MKLVLDASMALAWLFQREKKIEAEIADKLLLLLADIEILVPTLWHIEIANSLLVAERKGFILEAQVIDYLNRLYHLPINIDDSMPKNRDLVMSLARQYKLTAYDSTYLDLALREHAILATFDNKLAQSMRHVGGKVFGDE